MTETSAHTLIQEVVQRIYDDYGVQVDSISVDWRDVSTYNNVLHQVKSVNVSSRKAIEP